MHANDCAVLKQSKYAFCCAPHSVTRGGPLQKLSQSVWLVIPASSKHPSSAALAHAALQVSSAGGSFVEQADGRTSRRDASDTIGADWRWWVIFDGPCVDRVMRCQYLPSARDLASAARISRRIPPRFKTHRPAVRLEGRLTETRGNERATRRRRSRAALSSQTLPRLPAMANVRRGCRRARRGHCCRRAPTRGRGGRRLLGVP